MVKQLVSKKGLKNVRAAFADARRAMEEGAVDMDLVKDPNYPRNDIKPGEWPGAPWDDMPPGCPVQVLGYNGALTYCRSATGQLMAIEKWSGGEVEKLFAPYINYAHWAWPAKASAGKDENGDPLPALVKRLERDKARNCLINEGARRGLFDPQDSVRGRGGWRDRGDRFIWNSGGWLWTIAGKGAAAKLQAARPAEYDGYFYEMKADVTRPWEESVSAEESPSLRIYRDLCTWSFERGKLDALIVLGWFATGFMGGALAWRPIIFTTGGAGVGKSTMQSLMKLVLGKALHATTDTTQAGIYQRVVNDSLPVMVDELENKPGSTKAMAVVELARLAASGGYMYRGGSDHQGVAFQARNSFFFSAINPPPLGVQDRSRMAILNLSRLDKATKAMEITTNENDGRMILRQIMDGWTDFLSEILPRWKKALREAGLDSRAQDTYGTLLAAAELLLGAEAMNDAGIDVTEMTRAAIAIADATASERAEQSDNWQNCLEHVMASPIEAWRSGERITVGSVLDDLRTGRIDLEQGKFRLAAGGLGVRDKGDPCEGYALAIPFKGPTLEKIFADQVWKGAVWPNALKQGPKSIVLRDLDQKFRKMRIGGVVQAVLLVDMAAFDRWTNGDEA